MLISELSDALCAQLSKEVWVVSAPSADEHGAVSFKYSFNYPAVFGTTSNNEALAPLIKDNNNNNTNDNNNTDTKCTKDGMRKVSPPYTRTEYCCTISLDSSSGTDGPQSEMRMNIVGETVKDVEVVAPSVCGGGGDDGAKERWWEEVVGKIKKVLLDAAPNDTYMYKKQCNDDDDLAPLEGAYTYHHGGLGTTAGTDNTDNTDKQCNEGRHLLACEDGCVADCTRKRTRIHVAAECCPRADTHLTCTCTCARSGAADAVGFDTEEKEAADATGAGADADKEEEEAEEAPTIGYPIPSSGGEAYEYDYAYGDDSSYDYAYEEEGGRSDDYGHHYPSSQTQHQHQQRDLLGGGGGGASGCFDDPFDARAGRGVGGGGGGLPSLPSALEGDLFSLRARLGSDEAVEARRVGSGYWVTVTLSVKGIVSSSVARAFGVLLDEPVTLRLEFVSAEYPGPRPPKVRLFQKQPPKGDDDDEEDLSGRGEEGGASTAAADEASLAGNGSNANANNDSNNTNNNNKTNDAALTKKPARDEEMPTFPLGQQLSRAVEQYLHRRWGGSSFSPLQYPPQYKAVATQGEALLKQLREAPSSTAKKAASSSSSEADVAGALILMGFEEPLAQLAVLQRSSLADAASWLLGEMRKGPEKAFSELRCGGEGNDPRGVEEGRLPSGDSAEAVAERERMMFAGFSLTGPSRSSVEGDDTATDKFVPYSIDDGLLVHLVGYLLHRVPTAASYCILCDCPHRLGAAMVRPAVCADPLCVFAFTNLKVGTDAGSDLAAVDAGSLDLLVNIFRVAASSASAEGLVRDRADRIMTPYPSVEDPAKRGVLALDPTRRDYKTVSVVSATLPTTDEIVFTPSADALRNVLEKRHPLAYPLFSWIVSSNRSYVVKIHKNAMLRSAGTSHQFLLTMSTPEREEKFRQLKKRHGTRWAFHGSPSCNWHSIMRNGLMNMSGTSYQLNGAAHGSGVYFAPEFRTSIGYSRGIAGSYPSTAQQGGTANAGRYIDPNKMVCVALCEIVSNAVNDKGWCWTVTEEESIMTRFFLVFPDGVAPPETMNLTSANDSPLIADVKVAMRYYGMEF